MIKPWKVIAVTWSEEGNACLEIEGLKRVGAAEANLISAAPLMYAELQNVVNADYRKWDKGSDTAEDFVRWAKNRAQFILAKAESVPELDPLGPALGIS